MIAEREVITDSESWLDLRDGEVATVFGKLDSVSFDNTAITIRFSDWSSMVIDCPDGGAINMFINTKLSGTLPKDSVKAAGDGSWLKPIIALNTLVRVSVERTEDGLKGVAIWEPGCAPIPLMTDG